MSIEIKEVKSKSDLRTFIYLPEAIHKDHKNWLHPIYLDEWKFFSAKKNSLFQHNDTILLLAYENKKPVGRVMGIVPNHFNQMHNIKSARFAFVETYNNIQIFNSLINAVENWASERNCNEVVGPMGFSDKEPQGFLISGFDAETMLMTNCSLQFMINFIETNGYKQHVDLCQYEAPLYPEMINRYKVFAQRVESRNSITIHEFKSTKAIRPFVVPVFNLINKTYLEIYGFSSLTSKEANEFSNRFLPLLNPELIKIITNTENEVIAFVVAMPDLSIGIRKARGRLFPFGWIKILKSGKKSKRLVLLLGAISDEVRNIGMDAILAHRLLKSAISRGFTTVDSHLIMRENIKMRQEIERLENFRMYKEYRIFRKEI